MAASVKKSIDELSLNQSLKGKFDTAEEGARAKAEYVTNTVLKDFDWNAFVQLKNQPKSQQ